ncbi:hypothetical protein [Treponema sp.]|uniref:hypothetical protein n=1 Tax=Treponema sp. TaxID=166 RepID=UPI0025EE8DEC|nr:hypothetical protein [Treponema sp.]MCR5217510.1 hypothetical protein [Treponema sp.]
MTIEEERLYKEIVDAYPILRTFNERIDDFFANFKVYLAFLDREEDPPVYQDFRDDYLETVQEKYRKVTQSNLDVFASYCSTIAAHFYDIKKDDVVGFVKDLYAQGMSQGSVRVLVSRVRTFYNYLISRRVILVNPFELVKLSEIEYKSGEQFLVPDEDELRTITSELPLEKAAIVALMSIKGYSLTALYNISYSYLCYVNHKGDQDQYIRTVFCWTMEDVWDYPLDKKVEDTWEVDDNAVMQTYKGYYDYINEPDWYNKILFDYWDEIPDEEYEYGEGPARGEFFYINNNIPLHSCENIIIKKIKQLYEEGKIKHPYGLKNLRAYAVKRIYTSENESGSDNSQKLHKIQKMLGHSTLNTTKRYLQNMGLPVE